MTDDGLGGEYYLLGAIQVATELWMHIAGEGGY